MATKWYVLFKFSPEGVISMGEVVMFGKEFVSLCVAVKLAKKCRLAEAYGWAMNQQRLKGLSSDLLRLTFEHGDFIADRDDYIASVFCNPFTGEAILRQDWPRRNIIHYDVLVNLGEIARKAPKSLGKMVKNGLRLASES